MEKWKSNRWGVMLVLALILLGAKPARSLSDASAQSGQIIPGKIAYVGTDNNLWLFDGASGEKVQLSSDGRVADTAQIGWSYDGVYVAYSFWKPESQDIDRYGFRVIDAASRQIVFEQEAAYFVSWFPRDHRLGYFTYSGSHILNLDTLEQSSMYGDDLHPGCTLTDQNSVCAFGNCEPLCWWRCELGAEGNPGPGDKSCYQKFDIYNLESEQVLAEIGNDEFWPAYSVSPDGNRVAYITNDSGSLKISVMGMNGENKRIFDNPVIDSGDLPDLEAWEPSWLSFSSDGQSLLYAMKSAGASGFTIYSLDIAGGGINQLFQSTNTRFRTYSSDRQWVVSAPQSGAYIQLDHLYRQEGHVLDIPGNAVAWWVQEGQTDEDGDAKQNDAFDWRISYQRENGSVWAIELDGNNRQQVITSDEIPGDVGWSFDGNYLGYVYHVRVGESGLEAGGTRIIEVDARKVVVDIPKAQFIKWSGTDYRFIYYTDAESRYYVYDLQTSTKTPLKIDNQVVEWSRSGKYVITYQCKGCQAPNCCEKGSFFQIYDLELDKPAINVFAPNPCPWPVVKISPDETQWAVTPERLSIFNLNGTILRKLDEISLSSCSDDWAAYPDANPENLFVFSEDSRSILFVNYPNPEIYKLDLESGNVTQIQKLPAEHSLLSFSPDGQWIAYAASPWSSSRGEPIHVEHLYRDEKYTLAIDGYWTSYRLLWGKMPEESEQITGDDNTQLINKLTSFVEDSKNILGQVTTDNWSSASDGAYFVQQKAADEIGTGIDIVFGMASFFSESTEFQQKVTKLLKAPGIDLPGTNPQLPLPGFEYSKLDAMLYLGRFDSMSPELQREIVGLRAQRGLIKYGIMFVKDAGEEITEEDIGKFIAKEGAQLVTQALDDPSSFTRYHQEDLAYITGRYQSTLDLQLKEVLKKLPQYSPEEQAVIAKDLRLRAMANNWDRELYWRKTLFLGQVRAKRESSVSSQIAEYLLQLFLKLGAKYLSAYLFDGPGILLVEGTDFYLQLKHDYNLMNEDQMMIDAAFSNMITAGYIIDRIQFNSLVALNNVSNKISPKFPTLGDMELVDVILDDQTVKLPKYVVGNFSDGGYDDGGNWLELKSYTRFRLSNPASFQVTYRIIAEYDTVSGFLDKDHRHQIVEGAVILDPGETQNFELPFKQEHYGGGIAPEVGSQIIYRIIGHTDTGMYPVDTFLMQYFPAKVEIAQIQQPKPDGIEIASTVPLFQIQQNDNWKILPYPVTSALVLIPQTLNYRLFIDVENPYDHELTINLSQPISADWQVLDSAGAIYKNDRLEWIISLPPGKWKSLEVIMVWKGEMEETVSLLPTEADLYKTPDNRFHLQTLSMKASVPKMLSGEVVLADVLYRQTNDAAIVTLRNLSSVDQLSATVELCFLTITGQQLGCSSKELQIFSKEEKRVSLPTELAVGTNELAVAFVWVTSAQDRYLLETQVVRLVDAQSPDYVPEPTEKLTEKNGTKLPSNLPLLILTGAGGAVLIVALLVGTFFIVRRRKLSVVKTNRPAPASSEPAAPISQLDRLLQQGMQQVKSGDIEGGYNFLMRALKENPESANAWLVTGWAAAKKGDYRMAERCLLQAQKMGHSKAAGMLEWMRKEKAKPG